MTITTKITISMIDIVPSIVISPLNNFSISVGQNGNYKASGPTVTFNATTDTWGPVQNIFLTNVSSGTDGYLISSARLLDQVTVTPADSITLKFSFAFSN